MARWVFMCKKIIQFLIASLFVFLISANILMAQENTDNNADQYTITIALFVMDYVHVSPSVAEHGDIVTVRITSPANYRLAENGITATNVSEFTDNILGSNVVTFVMPPEAVEINAIFEPIITYGISIAPTIASFVSVSHTVAEEGQIITVHVAPPVGLRLANNGITATGVTNFTGNNLASTLIRFHMPAEDIEIDASFEEIPVYSISVSPMEENYLTITPPIAQVGQLITVSITPPSGQRLVNNGITATNTTEFNGNITGATWVTFVLTTGHTVVYAEFEIIPVYSKMVSPNSADYLHVNQTSAEEGQTILVTVTPPDGQRLAEDGVTATNANEFTGNIAGSTLVSFVKTSGNTEIHANFETTPIYSVSIVPSALNYLDVDLYSAEVGRTIIVGIMPPAGRRLSENGVSATGVTDFRGNVAGSTLVAFDMPAENIEVNVAFELLPPIMYSITVDSSALPNVHVSPPMAVAGQTVTLTIVPPIGQRLARDGVYVTDITSLDNNVAGATVVTFVMIQSDVDIRLTFETTPLTFLASFIFDPVRASLFAGLFIVLVFFALYFVRTRRFVNSRNDATITILAKNEAGIFTGNSHTYTSDVLNNLETGYSTPIVGGDSINSTLKITINSKSEYNPKIINKPYTFHDKMPNPQNDVRRYLIFTKESFGELQGAIDWGMHTRRNRVEQGGVLLGRAYRCNNEIYNIVKHIVLADTNGSPVSVEFSSNTWAQMQDELSCINSRLALDEQIFITGWFHTHPNGLNVFMSVTDKNTQRLNFNQDWQVSLVLNPHTQKYEAFFGERNDSGRIVVLANIKWSDLEHH